MKEKILKLRKQGLSYGDISKTLGCSKSTAIYHCNPDQKEKSRIRKNKNRNKNPLKTKISRFLSKKVKDKVRDFQRNREGTGTFKKGRENNFNYKDFINKVKENPVCYLTGRLINLENTKDYHLDHIMPISKGGKSDLNNMGLACKEANKGKDELTVEQFIELCKDVLTHNGYSIQKIN